MRGGGDSVPRAQRRKAAKPKLSTEELRDAVRAPSRIAGRAGVKEVLDAVLAGFCIGK